MSNNVIRKLLYDIFSNNAIKSAAIDEQLEDIKYCIEHHMNHMSGGIEEAKWNEQCKISETLTSHDNTYNRENMKKFKNSVDAYIENHPDARIYDGLSETEHYAVRRLYYYNNYWE